MGWMKIGQSQEAEVVRHSQNLVQRDHPKSGGVEWVEDISSVVPPSPKYAFVSSEMVDEELPFIPKEEVMKHKDAETGGLWIVINNVVYDCTTFILKHPGGQQIIKSFAGAECTWQFFKFHGKSILDEFGTPLRVGQTKGLVNKFKEPPRFVGLRKLGLDECY